MPAVVVCELSLVDEIGHHVMAACVRSFTRQDSGRYTRVSQTVQCKYFIPTDTV